MTMHMTQKKMTVGMYKHFRILTKKKHVWRYQRIEGEVDYACNVCDEGLDTEDDMKKYLNKYHQEILLNIWKESGDKVQNQNQDKKFKVLIK